MKPVDLMIFDFDGTLVNTGEDIARAVNHTLRSLGIGEKSREEIISYVGDGLQVLLEKALGPEIGRYEEAKEIFTSFYRDHLLDNTRLYPGVAEVLGHFGAKKKWIVTNKQYDYTTAIAEGLGISTYFDGIVGRDNGPYAKPDPRVLQEILEGQGVEKGRAVVIGDGVQDVKMARNAGIEVCAFLNGLGDREKLLRQRPDYSCENIIELKALFC
ncbi:MAG: HAD family hydrolase [Syntrophobacterales bacterium]|nr:HAD family hydrolase [Syntrophobacterales bacterium]